MEFTEIKVLIFIITIYFFFACCGNRLLRVVNICACTKVIFTPSFYFAVALSNTALQTYRIPYSPVTLLIWHSHGNREAVPSTSHALTSAIKQAVRSPASSTQSLKMLRNTFSHSVQLEFYQWVKSGVMEKKIIINSGKETKNASGTAAQELPSSLLPLYLNFLGYWKVSCGRNVFSQIWQLL